MDGCKISVIIPTFNRMDKVTEALNSVLNQTFNDYEIIVVDDGSTDNTRKIVTAITSSRIRYYYKYNGGASTARNFGLKKARGRWVCFLDSDDVYRRRALEFFNVAFQKYPEAAIAYGRLSCSSKPHQENDSPDFIPIDAYPQLVFRNVLSTAIAVKAEIARAIRYQENLPTAEDYKFALDVAREHPAVFIDDVLYEYRLSDQSKSSYFIENGDYCNVIKGIIDAELLRLPQSARKDILLVTNQWRMRKICLEILSLAMQSDRNACTEIVRGVKKLDYDLCSDLRYVIYRLQDVEKRVAIAHLIIKAIRSNRHLINDSAATQLCRSLADAVFLGTRSLSLKEQLQKNTDILRTFPEYRLFKKFIASTLYRVVKW